MLIFLRCLFIHQHSLHIYFFLFRSFQFHLPSFGYFKFVWMHLRCLVTRFSVLKQHFFFFFYPDLLLLMSSCALEMWTFALNVNYFVFSDSCLYLEFCVVFCIFVNYNMGRGIIFKQMGLFVKCNEFYINNISLYFRCWFPY